MAKRKEQVLSAQVVLRPASGRKLGGDSAITAETLAQYQPSPEAAKRVREKLARAGFEIGPLVGNSFSITAPASTFQKFFATKVREAGKGGLEFESAGGMELAAEALPRSLAEDVAAVTFTPPPDFGPTSY
jgi:hypothetical protein